MEKVLPRLRSDADENLCVQTLRCCSQEFAAICSDMMLIENEPWFGNKTMKPSRSNPWGFYHLAEIMGGV
jgi:hypothetical protein